MKKLKKTLAVVMVIVLLMSVLPMVSVGAEESYTALSLDAPTTVRLEEYGAVCVFTPEKDGAYKFYSLGDVDTVAALWNPDWDMIAYSLNDDSSFSLSADLKAGETYNLEIAAPNYSGEYVDIQVVVEETVGIESMEITQYPYDTTLIEYYEYESFSADGLEITFTFTDGSTVDWVYQEYEYGMANNMVGDYLVDVYVDYDDDYNYYAYIECGGLVETIPYTIVESPIESIEYFSETPIEYYVNSNGYWMDDDRYFYYYEVPEDAVITINYKDGTSVEASYEEEVDGVYFYDYSYQETTDTWSVGSDNYFYIYYLDQYVKVPVTILPSPFKSVTLNSAPTRDYIFGDYETGYFDYNGEYTLWPADITGLSFTVEYEDGTKETYDDDDFDEYHMQIDGYEYNVSEHIMTEPGTVEATLYYKGAQIKYNVDVVESYIESIEVLKAPDKAEYEGICYADFTGTVVKINYKDGTSAQATANENTLSYTNDGWVTPQIKVGDDVVSIYYEVDLDTMERYDYFTCAGVGLNYYGVTYNNSREVVFITAENVTMSGDGMVVTVEYEDGTSEKLTFDTLAYYENSEDFTDACAMTENGVIDFSIEKWVDDNGNLIGYNVFAFGNEYFAQAEGSSLLGDVDNDGEVSIMDATAIQMYAAELMELSIGQLACGDVDYDDVVTVMDATKIQMFVAQLIEEL